MSALLKELGAELKRLRDAKGISQRDLAKRIAMTQAQLSKIENGQADLRASTLFQIVRSLEHDYILIPRQEILAVKAILSAKEKPEEDWAQSAYTPDEED